MPLNSTVTSNVVKGSLTNMSLPFKKIAVAMFGRVWNDGSHWLIPLDGWSPVPNFDEVQYRLLGESGPWSHVGVEQWSIINYQIGDYVEKSVQVTDTPGIDVEFRLVHHAGGKVDFAWYPPYTCGTNSCTRPAISSIEGPLN